MILNIKFELNIFFIQVIFVNMIINDDPIQKRSDKKISFVFIWKFKVYNSGPKVLMSVGSCNLKYWYSYYLCAQKDDTVFNYKSFIFSIFQV